MNYQDINARTIDRWVDEGWEWGRPIDHETFLKARRGDWSVVLTPVKPVPREWFGDLEGKRLLGLACGLLIYLPLKVGSLDINPIVTTFLSTVVSGYTFAIIVGLMNGLELPVIFVTYAIMVFGTATFNAFLVQILTPLLRKVLKK